MPEIKDHCYRGTRILLGNEKRTIINSMVSWLVLNGFQEIAMPIIQEQETFSGKVGAENQQLMYKVIEPGERDLCLAPEYTAVIQKLALGRFKYEKDVRLFYVQECFRGERPQAGRYRQFTQLGVEVLHPTDKDVLEKLIGLAENLIAKFGIPGKTEVQRNVTRGLDYYTGGKGFEITYDLLGSSKQICGGGEYQGGIGFAIGVDRILSLKNNVQ